MLTLFYVLSMEVFILNLWTIATNNFKDNSISSYECLLDANSVALVLHFNRSFSILFAKNKKFCFTE